MSDFDEKPPENGEDEIQYSGFDLRRDIKPKIDPVWAGLIGLFGGFVLYQFIGGIITILIFGMDMEKAPVNSMRLMTAAGQILFILLPALILTKAIYEDVTNVIRVKFPRPAELGIFTAGLLILSPLLQYYLFVQNYYFNILAQHNSAVMSIKKALDELNVMVDKTYGSLLTANNFAEGLLVIAVVAVVPAFCEEFMFRGFIQRSFEFKMRPFGAALLTAVFFGIYHFNFYALIPLIGLGLYFGFASYTSNSIFVPVVLHFLNNLTSVILFFILGKDELSDSAAASGADIQSAIYALILLAILFIAFILFVKRYYLKNKKS